MTTEDDRNIDDLVDYKDFESNLESNSDQDSFNKDIMKIYEDHKKKGGDKQTEVQNPQRPVSKYQRNLVSAGRREEETNNQEEIMNTNNNNNNNEILSENEKSSREGNTIDYQSIKDNFITRFNNFINRTKLKKSDFMDNPRIYYTIEEFKEIFKKLRFEISNSEINFIFSYNNPSASDGYLLGQTFLEKWKEEITWWDKDDSKALMYEGNHLYTEYHSNNNNLNQVPSKRTETEMKKINEEFKMLQDEVFQIVAKESRPKSSAKFPNKRNITSSKQNTSGGGNNLISNNLNPVVSNKNSRPTSNITYNNTQSKGNNQSKIVSVGGRVKLQSASYLKETLLKKKAEEEIIRLAIERRNKEHERDCIKKMCEANQMAEELAIPRSYSAYTDESDGVIICRVFDKLNKQTNDIDLKKFLMEHKKLAKLIKQKELTKYYKEQPTNEEVKNTTKENLKEENLLLLGRQQRQKKIKEVLIDSLELKMKLKKQLKALRDKNLVDPSIIKANLKLINLDDENIL